MFKNHKLSREILHLGWRQFLRYSLERKAEKYSCDFRVISRWEPTSKICPSCGFKSGKLYLLFREWFCLNCDSKHDHNKNAAINIQRFPLLWVCPREQNFRTWWFSLFTLYIMCPKSSVLVMGKEPEATSGGGGNPQTTTKIWSSLWNLNPLIELRLGNNSRTFRPGKMSKVDGKFKLSTS